MVQAIRRRSDVVDEFPLYMKGVGSIISREVACGVDSAIFESIANLLARQLRGARLVLFDDSEHAHNLPHEMFSAIMLSRSAQCETGL